jgi:glycosyltransferase involved in cell wall biosynthesis
VSRRRAADDDLEGLRVLHVSLHDPDLRQGAGSHVSNTAVILASLHLDAMTVRGHSAAPRIRRFFQVIPRALRGLRRAELVWLRAHPVAVILAAAARVLQRPVVLEVNGTPADLVDAHPWGRPLLTLHRLADRLLVLCASVIVVPSEGLREELGFLYGVGAEVVHNAANGTEFAPSGPVLPWGRRYVAFVGTLAPWQGLDTALAAAMHPDWPSDVDLLVAGAGPEHDSLAERASSLPRVTLLGRLDRADVASLLRGALVSLSPRQRRGASPLKVFESLACGTPVVASDIPDHESLAGQLGGITTYRRGEPVELVRSLRRVAEDDEYHRELVEAALGARARVVLDARRTDVRRVIEQALQR